MLLSSFSLSRKVILLMAATLILELVFVSSLGILHERAEQEAERAEHSTRITEAINLLAREIYGFLSVLNSRTFTPAFFETDVLPHFREGLQTQFQVLKAETRGKPFELKIVLESEAAAERGLAILNRLEGDLSARATLEDMAERQRVINELKDKGRFILSPEFVDLNSRKKEIVRRSPRKQAAIRNQQVAILWVAVVLNILCLMAATIWLVRSITGRLQIMSDNAFRFARGKELNPVMAGSDEIAILDRSFHNMAESVRRASAKERAIVEQARDVICSIDQDGKFTAINPAAEKILSYKSAELLGQDYTRLVAADDFEYLSQTVAKARKEGDVEPTEVRLTARDGTIIDTLWSMHWSSAENSLFCVIHDDSARKQVERLRQDLIAMITHDMKTPLSFMSNFLELLDDKVIGKLDKQGEEMLAMANNCLAEMSKMVNDMLDMERVKAGMVIVNASKVPVASLIDSACGRHSTIAGSAGIKLEKQTTGAIVNVDAEMIVRVISNLLANAIKFSPAGSTITVRAVRQENLVTVSVSDQGCGIPKDLGELVFEKYIQVPGHKQGGSGLGLAICKAFVELNGGKIRLESQENQGTVISFDLPAADSNHCQK
jgi:PAS domain S-box-containing protein